MKRLRAWLGKRRSCGATRHVWNVTEEEARRCEFLRADCIYCGYSIDAVALVRTADHCTPSTKAMLLRGLAKP